MDTIQITLIALALTGLVALLAIGLLGPSAAKEGTRRLQAVRLRHSNSALDRVEAQLRKAVASRMPKAHRIAGSGSRVEADRKSVV